MSDDTEWRIRLHFVMHAKRALLDAANAVGPDFIKDREGAWMKLYDQRKDNPDFLQKNAEELKKAQAQCVAVGFLVALNAAAEPEERKLYEVMSAQMRSGFKDWVQSIWKISDDEAQAVLQDTEMRLEKLLAPAVEEFRRGQEGWAKS